MMGKTGPVSADISNRLFEAANNVAVHHALNSHWSLFHLWQYVHEHESDKTQLESVLDEIAPFASCLGLAYLVQRDLKTKLMDDPELSSFVDNVQIMTNRKTADSDDHYHAITVLEMERSCIVVDTSVHPTAFQLELGQSFDVEIIPNFKGNPMQVVMRYIKLGSQKVLQAACIGANEKLENSDFRSTLTKIDYIDAMQQLAIPGAQQLVKVPNKTKLVPSEKRVEIWMLIDEKPQYMHATSHNGKYIIMSCRCSIRFDNLSVWLQIPKEDWLEKAENWELQKRLRLSAMGIEKYKGTMVLKWSASDLTDHVKDAQMLRDLYLLDDIAVPLGMPKGEVLNIGKSVVEVCGRQLPSL